LTAAPQHHFSTAAPQHRSTKLLQHRNTAAPGFELFFDRICHTRWLKWRDKGGENPK
jgi:hypothetical protein